MQNGVLFSCAVRQPYISSTKATDVPLLSGGGSAGGGGAVYTLQPVQLSTALSPLREDFESLNNGMLSGNLL